MFRRSLETRVREAEETRALKEENAHALSIVPVPHRGSSECGLHPELEGGKNERDILAGVPLWVEALPLQKSTVSFSEAP